MTHKRNVKTIEHTHHGQIRWYSKRRIDVLMFEEMNLNRALHCNQMIIHKHVYEERSEDIEGEIDDHENGGIRENSRHAWINKKKRKKKKQCTVDLIVSK